VQPIADRSERNIKRLASQLGLDLRRGPPGAGGVAGRAGDWWREPSWRLCSDGVALGWHRGWSFADDWVREVWLLAPPKKLCVVAPRFRRWLTGQGASHLRFWIDGAASWRVAQFWSQLGAETLMFERRVPRVLYQLAHDARAMRLTVRGGLRVGPCLLTELAQLIAWSQDRDIYLPLGFDSAPEESQLLHAIFPEQIEPNIRGMRFFCVRQEEHLVGLVIEHDWDYLQDSMKEIDLALPGLVGQSPRLVP